MYLNVDVDNYWRNASCALIRIFTFVFEWELHKGTSRLDSMSGVGKALGGLTFFMCFKCVKKKITYLIYCRFHNKLKKIIFYCYISHEYLVGLNNQRSIILPFPIFTKMLVIMYHSFLLHKNPHICKILNIFLLCINW